MTDPDLFNFRFLGGPLDELDESAPVFEAIGFAAASFARLEQHIDAVLVHVNKDAHSDRLYNPDHPVSFGAKARLLKRWFNQHAGLAEHRETMRELTTRLKELSSERNKFLHSILDAYDPATQTATFRSTKFIGKDEFKVMRHVGTISTLVSFAVETNLDNCKLATISAQLFTEDALRRLRKL